MVLARLTGAVVYLAGTGVWTLLMLLFGALRCDDSCSADSTSWAHAVGGIRSAPS
jgi:hypothetical protein